MKRPTAFLLKRSKRCFSPAFYELYSRRYSAAVSSYCGCLAIAAVLAGGSVWAMFAAHGPVLLAAALSSVFLLMLVSGVPNAIDLRVVRVLPFFERAVGGTDTFLAGKALAWNGLMLDETCAQLGVAPLSAFASGDPAARDEPTALYDPAEALPTVEALLGAAGDRKFETALVQDLQKLHSALQKADDGRIRFSLHLRIGTGGSSLEMERRGGSYF